jgi:Domain of unknown function (DUF4260)
MMAARLSTDQKPTTAGLSMPNVILRAEGAAIFVAAVAYYVSLHASGWLFAALILAPDLSALGYLAGTRVGSVTYNAIHTLVVPLAVLALALILGSPTGVQVALIWLAHIGIDRALGFGIKYPTVFQDTHLQHI